MICSSLLVNFYDLNLKRKLQPSMSLPCFLCCCWISHHNATFFSVVLYRCWMLPLLPSQFAKAYNDLNRNSHSSCYDVKLVDLKQARLSDTSYGKQWTVFLRWQQLLGAHSQVQGILRHNFLSINYEFHCQPRQTSYTHYSSRQKYSSLKHFIIFSTLASTIRRIRLSLIPHFVSTNFSKNMQS